MNFSRSAACAVALALLATLAVPTTAVAAPKQIDFAYRTANDDHGWTCDNRGRLRIAGGRIYFSTIADDCSYETFEKSGSLDDGFVFEIGETVNFSRTCEIHRGSRFHDCDRSSDFVSAPQPSADASIYNMKYTEDYQLRSSVSTSSIQLRRQLDSRWEITGGAIGVEYPPTHYKYLTRFIFSLSSGKCQVDMEDVSESVNDGRTNTSVWHLVSVDKCEVN